MTHCIELTLYVHPMDGGTVHGTFRLNRKNREWVINGFFWAGSGLSDADMVALQYLHLLVHCRREPIELNTVYNPELPDSAAMLLLEKLGECLKEDWDDHRKYSVA